VSQGEREEVRKRRKRGEEGRRGKEEKPIVTSFPRSNSISSLSS
jgi:hypothetical protein